MDGVGSHIYIYGYNPHILALRGGGEIDLLMGGYLAEKSLLAPSISYYMQVSKWFWTLDKESISYSVISQTNNNIKLCLIIVHASVLKSSPISIDNCWKGEPNGDVYADGIHLNELLYKQSHNSIVCSEM